MKFIKIIALFAFCCSLTSCASIVHGRRQEVDVTSNPPGATVSDGVQTWTTPAKISLARKTTHQLTFSKPGYETHVVQLHRAISGAVAGNLLAGGLIGWGVDAISGAQWKLIPEMVSVTLHPQVAKAETKEEVKSPVKAG